jgi:aspartate 1-decarboxylase
MFLNMHKSKIHRATVTEANLNYVGSITIDVDLLEKSNILVGELVHIVNINNGARVETYTIEGTRGSGIIGINGAAARNFHEGDLVIIISYALMEPKEAKEFKPTVVFVNEKNQVVEISDIEIHGQIK